MNRARFPIIVVLMGLLVAALVVEQSEGLADPEPPGVGLERVAPMTDTADVLGSTWYCAAGSSDPDGYADHTLIIANPTAADRQVEVTAFPGQADPVIVTIEVPATSLERVVLADLVEAPAVAAMVETDGGEVAVYHELDGPLGLDRGPCASASSDIWHFAWGDTSADARSLYALFNPFPGDAVVDFDFVTIDGSRSPQALTGVVVPGRSVVVIDVGDEVARRDQVSATLDVRAGRVVAERVQLFDDSEEMLEGAAPRRGLTVDLGVPSPMVTWVHPSVRLAEGLTEQVVVYNPGNATAEVDIEVLISGQLGGIEPFEVTVAPNRYEVVELTDQARLIDRFIDEPVDVTVIVRSLNDVPIVTERMTMVPTSAQGSGLAASTGTAVVGRELLVVDPRPMGADSASLTLVNPDPERLVTGSISILSRGVERPLAGYEEIEIGPSGRLVVDDLVDLVSGSGTSMLVIETTRPLAAGVTIRGSEPFDRSGVIAMTRSDLAELPPDIGLGG